jgi:predicted phage terminase large subunit-like protein
MTSLSILEAKALVRAELDRLRRPDARPWTAQAGPQRLFFDIDCDETLYGGQAGGGKSASIIALASAYMHIPGYRGLVLRRSTPQLGSLIDETREMYLLGRDNMFAPFAPSPKARIVEAPHAKLIFANGARVWLGHCNDKNDWQIYHGQQFDTVAFDELPQFEERQYLEIKGRVRGSTPGVRRRTVATANPPTPDEPGATWVKRRWGPWLDREFEVPDWEERDDAGNMVRGHGLPTRIEDGTQRPAAVSGQILYVANVRGQERFSARPFTWNGVVAPTRTFIRARLADNPALLRATPNYIATLHDNDPVRVAQLAHGDWDIKPAAGLYFKLAWCEFVDAAPPDTIWARAWDLAATIPTPQSPDPDWTVGVKLGRSFADGHFYFAGAERDRRDPGGVRALTKDTAKEDGAGATIVLPQDPGQAGKDQIASYTGDLVGYSVSSRAVSGAKLTRFGPFSTQASPQSTGGQYGRIRIVRGAKNLKQWAAVLESFDGLGKAHDDDADATADAFNYLAAVPKPAAPVKPPPVRTVNWETQGMGLG